MRAPTCEAAVKNALAAAAAQQSVLAADHAGDPSAQRAARRVEELVGDGGRRGRVGGRHEDGDARWAAGGEGVLVEELLVALCGGVAGRTEARSAAGAITDEEGVGIVVAARKIMPDGGIDDVEVETLEQTGLQHTDGGQVFAGLGPLGMIGIRSNGRGETSCRSVLGEIDPPTDNPRSEGGTKM